MKCKRKNSFSVFKILDNLTEGSAFPDGATPRDELVEFERKDFDLMTLNE